MAFGSSGLRVDEGAADEVPPSPSRPNTRPKVLDDRVEAAQPLEQCA
jgi:hypothetical protein